MKVLSCVSGTFAFHFTRVSCATREQVARAGARELAALGAITESDAEDVASQMLAREEQASSAIGGGVATPRAQVTSARRATCLVAVNECGVDCHSLDGLPVDVFFLIVASDADTVRLLTAHSFDLSFACGGARLIRQCRTEDDLAELMDLANVEFTDAPLDFNAA